MAFGCKLSLARWQKSFPARLQQLSPFTGPALISGLERGMFIKLQAKDCVGICCCWVCLSPFCSRAGFPLVDLHFLWYLRPSPSFLFQYICSSGGEVAHDFRVCISISLHFYGSSRVSAPGVSRLVSKMGSALWVLLFNMNWMAPSHLPFSLSLSLLPRDEWIEARAPETSWRNPGTLISFVLPAYL